MRASTLVKFSAEDETWKDTPEAVLDPSASAARRWSRIVDAAAGSGHRVAGNNNYTDGIIARVLGNWELKDRYDIVCAGQ